MQLHGIWALTSAKRHPVPKSLPAWAVWAAAFLQLSDVELAFGQSEIFLVAVRQPSVQLPELAAHGRKRRAQPLETALRDGPRKGALPRLALE